MAEFEASFCEYEEFKQSAVLGVFFGRVLFFIQYEGVMIKNKQIRET